MSEFLFDASFSHLILTDKTDSFATAHYYLNALRISVLSNSKMVYVSRLNCTTWSCPRNFTKLWPVVFQLLMHKFSHKMKQIIQAYQQHSNIVETLSRINYRYLQFITEIMTYCTARLQYLQTLLRNVHNKMLYSHVWALWLHKTLEKMHHYFFHFYTPSSPAQLHFIYIIIYQQYDSTIHIYEHY